VQKESSRLFTHPEMTEQLSKTKTGLLQPLLFAVTTWPWIHAEGAADMSGRAYEQLGVQVEIVKMPETCTEKVREGDSVSIHHKGFFGDVQIDSDGGKPLDVVVGSRHVLEGMERGMIGQCLGEVRKISMPPELGFDKPGMNFKHKPVPDGLRIS